MIRFILGFFVACFEGRGDLGLLFRSRGLSRLVWGSCGCRLDGCFGVGMIVRVGLIGCRVWLSRGEEHVLTLGREGVYKRGCCLLQESLGLLSCVC